MILFVWVLSLFGFQAEQQDTVRLQEIEVNAAVFETFGLGKKQLNWDKAALENYQSRSLSELLQEKSPLFIRQYGPGMLASPNFRGTSAGHTAVFWNGIPINSPSLGQSDLSIIPLAAPDRIDLIFGSDGALLGNEALGGSILLQSQASFQDSPTASISQEVGSFGQSATAFQAGFSGEKLAFQTKIYSQKAENDYTFRDLSLPGTPEKTQTHAAFSQKGIQQDIAWRINPSQRLNTSFWYNEADREIQPPMGSSTQDIQEDQSFRLSLEYLKFWDKSSLEIRSGWVRDDQVFNQSFNQTSSFFLSGDWEGEIGKEWKIRLGSRGTHIQGNLSTYSATDQRLETYQFIRFSGLKNINLSLNLRQLVVDQKWQPLLPSLGMDWLLSPTFSLKTSIARGLKVPTLNDRFWEPGGNPELLPEESWQGETGLRWNKGFFHSELTFFAMDVENWIIWIPKGAIWSPDNIRRVRNTGIEWAGGTEFAMGSTRLKIDLAYNYTQAINQSNSEESPTFWNRQLPYTPVHQAQGGVELIRDGYSFRLSSQYIGQRATTLDHSRIMDAYSLTQLHLNYKKLWLGPVQVPISLRIENLFNKSYQVLYLRPMPGRSIHLNLKIQL